MARYGNFRVYRGKGKRNKKRPWYKRNYSLQVRANPQSVAQTAVKGLALARYVASMVNAEKKFTDLQFNDVTQSILDLSTTTPGTTDVFGNNNLFLLNQVAEGTSDSERTGNSVRLKHVQIRWQLQNTAGSGAYPVRIMVFQWKDNTIPTFPDVFNSDASGSYTVADTYDYYQKDTAGRKLNVLYDQFYHMVSLVNNPKCQINGYISLRLNMHTRYDDAAGLPSDNRLYFLVLPANVTTDDCNLNFSRRTDYVDN